MSTIKLDKDESLLLISALDFYSGIWIGQYDRLDACTDVPTFAFGNSPAEKELTDILLQARDIIIPQLRGGSIHSSLGIWNTNTDDRAMSAYDMQQIIRYARSWQLQPEGASTRSFDRPILEGPLPQIECVCSGEGRKFCAEITIQPACFELMNEAVKAYRYRYLGNFSRLMKHFTDDEEALGLIKRAESIYKTIATCRNEYALAKIDTLIELIMKSKLK